MQRVLTAQETAALMNSPHHANRGAASLQPGPTGNAGNFTREPVPQPTGRYTIISNDFLRGKLPVPLKKSLERMLLLQLLSFPGDGTWTVTRDHLDRSVGEGRDAVTNALNALETAGYLKRAKRRDAQGEFSWDWRVTADPVRYPIGGESPHTENQSMALTRGNTSEQQFKPQTENPATAGQSVLEDGRLKTDERQKIEKEGASSEGANAVDRSHRERSRTRSAHKPNTGPTAERLGLLGMPQNQLLQKHVAIWARVLRDEGGEPFETETGIWDYDGTRLATDRRHPYGSWLKSELERVEYDGSDRFSAEWHEYVLELTRNHAREWASAYPVSRADLERPNGAPDECDVTEPDSVTRAIGERDSAGTQALDFAACDIEPDAAGQNVEFGTVAGTVNEQQAEPEPPKPTGPCPHDACVSGYLLIGDEIRRCPRCSPRRAAAPASAGVAA